MKQKVVNAMCQLLYKFRTARLASVQVVIRDGLEQCYLTQCTPPLQDHLECLRMQTSSTYPGLLS